MVRYLIKFTKEPDIKFISHLDMMRTIQRMIRRSDLPVSYSKGFNPHMALSIAQPLPVGIYSSAEYMDVVFDSEIDEKVISESLNKCAPGGIRILETLKIRSINPGEKKIPQAMAAIDAAKYCANIKYTDASNIEKEMKCILNMAEWNMLKKTKTSEKEIDIKPLVKKIGYKAAGAVLNITAVVACGSRENLSFELLCDFFKKYSSSADMNAFTDIERKELYAISGNEYVPLDIYFKGR